VDRRIIDVDLEMAISQASGFIERFKMLILGRWIRRSVQNPKRNMVGTNAHSKFFMHACMAA
jgi:hypothetical protein